MAKLFAYDEPIVSDGVTAPNISTTQLKNSMAIVYNHTKGHNVASPALLDAALSVIAVAANNENWVVYVP